MIKLYFPRVRVGNLMKTWAYLINKKAMLCTLLFCVSQGVCCHPQWDAPAWDRGIQDGRCYYAGGMQSLASMVEEIMVTMGYVVGLLYAVASLLAIYNATVIYIKLNAGEEGFTKSVMMLFGSILFLIAATIVMPAFFGYEAYGKEIGSAWDWGF